MRSEILKNKTYRDKAFLGQHYLGLQESAYRIAKTYHCHSSQVYYWLDKFDVKVRSNSEAQRLLSSHVSLTKEAMQFVNGLLLGDGHLNYNCCTGAYTHSSKFRSYLVWQSAKFEGFGIHQVGRIRRHECWHTFPDCGDRLIRDVTFNYASRRYAELGNLHAEWYRRPTKMEQKRKPRQKYVKKLPSMIQLTPVVCLMWFLGDGSLNRKNRYITLSTQGFSIFEVSLLAKLLNGLGFKVAVYKNKDIGITKISSMDFLHYIGPCPVACYEYKWGSR